MKELSLFTGAGGGLLGTHLLGWEPIGYVEFNEYCQQVIAARIKDGIIPNAPIFSDIRAFISEGYAASYTGMVDVISGGFPCQPFSLAGKQAGADDERNMWPATLECIRIIRPRYAFLENVPGLISSGYFPTILSDLAESGYDARWRVLSAAEVGAPHKRDRLFIVADAKSITQREQRHETGSFNAEQYARVEHLSSGTRQPKPNTGQNVADAYITGLEEWDGSAEKRGTRSAIDGRSWWATEPAVGRVANGVASRVDRLRAVGNGQVPAVAATAWNLLNGQ